jgi:hypothetical protein
VACFLPGRAKDLSAPPLTGVWVTEYLLQMHSEVI